MMKNRAIPYRPKLEGFFRVRFYKAASKITNNVSDEVVEQIIANEINWVENKCVNNIIQRKKYRAVWLLLRDLVRANWKADFRNGILEMRLPTLDHNDLGNNTIPGKKKNMQSWMADSRKERLQNQKDFILWMESDTPSRKSVVNLIGDGKLIKKRLQEIKSGNLEVEEAIKPELILVSESERDDVTGHKLTDIWRYFRLTWSNPAETTPGRTMQYIIRDKAQPNWPIVGIASLENCAVQITTRDNFIGWTPLSFIENLDEKPNEVIIESFNRLINCLNDGINNIDLTDLCSVEETIKPSQELVERLKDLSALSEAKRQYLLKQSQSAPLDSDELRSDLGSITLATEDALFGRKRAEQLAKLLQAKRSLLNLTKRIDFVDYWKEYSKTDEGYSSIRTALITQKAKHIGSSMMELNVCGAIPPYNEILGGKLVALLALSPQVVNDYRERYRNQKSTIATRMKNEPVVKPSELVYIGTTSLYYVGSSQYNRLRIPKNLFGSSEDINWVEKGKTVGFGSMHISKATTAALTEATNDIGYSRINHVFGEGASPKMRLLTMSIRELLESNQEDSKDLAKHAMSRIVYCAFLASNTREYLLGLDEKPKYYFNDSDPIDGTNKIIQFWQNRWLKSRINFDPIYQKLEEFDKESIVVSNHLTDHEGWSFKKIELEAAMNMDDINKNNINFVQNLYRGTSAYADFMEIEYLKKLHVRTKLDDAIISEVKKGNDIVLTGNPGDGKTHIIRILHDELSDLTEAPVIEIDASTKTSAEIFNKWSEARNSNRPFVIAINAAVLFNLAADYPDFAPIQTAKVKLLKSITFHEKADINGGVTLFDLSKRNILTKNIIEAVISKLSKMIDAETCDNAGLYDISYHIRLINNPIFMERLYFILDRVAFKGYHATLRELQAFISYLIFGGRNLQEIVKTAGNDQFDVAMLVFENGEGTFFKKITEAFDPINVSHPIIDEIIVNNRINKESWISEFMPINESMDPENFRQFVIRKRRFFLFNENGVEIIKINDDEGTKFKEFLELPSKKLIKQIIKSLNAFFSESKSNGDLRVWSGHRYDHSARNILLSISSLKSSDFEIGIPRLNYQMDKGLDFVQDYLRFELKTKPNIFLKIDFSMFCLLREAERGVPVLYLDTDLVKKVWRFMEQLQPSTIEDDEISISILDVQGKKQLEVTVDLENRRYESIKYVKRED